MEGRLLLIAVATSTSLHAVMEPMNVLAKLRRLDTAINPEK